MNQEETGFKIKTSAKIRTDYSAFLRKVKVKGTIPCFGKWVLFEDGLLEISGKGDMPDWLFDEHWYSNAPWANGKLEDLIRRVVIQDGVRGIGDFAFLRCRNLTDITIPSSVLHIGIGVCWGCSNLKKVTTPKLLYEFHIPAVMGIPRSIVEFK